MLKTLMLLALSQFTNVPGVQLKDEGTTQGQVMRLNCSGAGITCSASGGTGTLTVTGGGGGGGSANVVEISVNLGTSGNTVFSATVTGQAWVTSTSVIACSPFATSADGQTVETYIAADLNVNAATRVVGTGFDIWINSPNGATGTFRFHCTGA